MPEGPWIDLISTIHDAALDLCSAILAASDVVTRSALIAATVVEQLPDSACAIYRYVPDDGEGEWIALGLAGDAALEQGRFTAVEHLMSALLSEPGAVIYRGRDLRREDYAHLHLTRSLEGLAYLPLLHQDHLLGAIEIISFSRVLEPSELEGLSPIAELAAPAIAAGEEGERQRQDLLDALHRMSQLYDLEKSLNSTLEFDSVTAMVPEKALAMLDCQAVHLWLFDGEVLRLVASEGGDATVELGMLQAPGDGYVADTAEKGEPLLIADADDERLALRNAGIEDNSEIGPVADVLIAPLFQDEAEVGVLEAINKNGRPFDDDDLFFLSSMAETVSSALKNASLMHAERKLAILEALVHVSSEITSTLRLDRLLQIIVNSPQNVLPYELCAIALDNRGRLQLKAVSGMSKLPMGDAAVARLEGLVRWLSSQESSLHLRWRENGNSEDGSNLPPEVLRSFQESGYRALYSVPLNDDQGRVGVLLFQSSEPDFLDLPHTEMIKILAGQATVAIRNALLYREVPLIGVLEPLIQKRAALLRTSGRRRLAYAGVATVVALFLVLFPLPMRVTGEAVVEPQHLATVAAPVEGNVDKVYVHEGQRVAAGELLATMNDVQWRADLAAAETKHQQALMMMEDDLARGSPRAGQDRTNANYLRSEVAQAQARIDSAQLRAPIAGILVTPNLQNAAGEHLNAGSSFAQVLDLSSALIRIAIPQRDASLIRPGQPAAVKLDSYPQRTWRNPVSMVSPQALASEIDRTISAEVPVPNTDALLHAGMTGKGKISIGLKPAGYVLLRNPALWLWQTLWNSIGW
ncbi:MAG: efflux RND transporter periplasmic adaptor subunit [Acidobacteriaceae bacterium]|nr:efflux RND transporter periplasmic adaptor subunit [Acidobacteriaceae bacterium]